MRLNEVAQNDKELSEFWTDAIRGAAKGIYKGAEAVGDYFSKDEPKGNQKDRRTKKSDNKTKRRRSGGSDDYDHIINKYK